MNAQELTAYFYRDIKGYSVSGEEETITKCTLKYLLENNIEPEEIKELLVKLKNKNCIAQETLPNDLWVINPKTVFNKITGHDYIVQDNLVKRNTFYYHPALMLRSKLPSVVNGKEVIEPYYCEPRCRFTITDLISYFCQQTGIDRSYVETQFLINSKILTVMNQYEQLLKTVEPLDTVMYAIDYAAKNAGFKFYNFMILLDFASDVISELKVRVAHIQAYGYDKIVWRTE